jgi:hypothetical protein
MKVKARALKILEEVLREYEGYRDGLFKALDDAKLYAQSGAVYMADRFFKSALKEFAKRTPHALPFVLATFEQIAIAERGAVKALPPDAATRTLNLFEGLRFTIYKAVKIAISKYGLIL